MPKKNELNYLKKIDALDKIRQKRKKNVRWILFILLWTFIISIALSMLSTNLLSNSSLPVAVFLLIVLIFIGILFDIVGVAVTAATAPPFHSMSSRKVFGAKKAVSLIKNADKVSSFCNDVVGDIIAIITGSMGAVIVVSVSMMFALEGVYMMAATMLVTAIISAISIGGKAVGKNIAINRCGQIVFIVAKILSKLSFKQDESKKHGR